MIGKNHSFNIQPQNGTTKSALLAKLKACSGSGDFEKVKKLHNCAVDNGFDSSIDVASSLMDKYAKCGNMEEARKVFDGLKCHDTVSWTVLMLGYVENGKPGLALDLFSLMEPEGYQPDARTFVAALKACSTLAVKEFGKLVEGGLVKVASLRKGMAIHCQAARNGHDQDMYVSNILLDMYAKCGSMMQARLVFNSMQMTNEVTWNTLMFGYVEIGEELVSLELFSMMPCKPSASSFVSALKACTSLAIKAKQQADGLLIKHLMDGMVIHSLALTSGLVWDMKVASILVDMYAKCGSMVDAGEVFNRMKTRDAVSWNGLLFGYAENGEEEVALQLFFHMRNEGCAPTAPTFAAVLAACGSLNALEMAKLIHTEVCRSGLDRDILVASALVDCFGKCGSMFEAQRIFDSLSRKDVVLWTSLILGYSRQGDVDQVFKMFDRMTEEGVQPNNVTFLCILSACNHAGLVQKGKYYFHSMWSKYALRRGIEHYHCIIDILCRANLLEDAVAMVRNMPFEPSVVTWTIVLDACRKFNNTYVGMLAFESMVSLDEVDSIAHVLMANIYTSWAEKEANGN